MCAEDLLVEDMTMRKGIGALFLGVTLAACGGDEAAKPPETPLPPTPVATVTAAPTTTASATPPAPKPTQAELQITAAKTLTDAMNAHDAKKFAAAYTDDATLTVAGMPEMHGRAEIEKQLQGAFDGFKDMKFWIVASWSKGDMAFIEWGWSGTNTGEWMGMKPTEKQAGGLGMSAFWFNADGAIKKENRYTDAATTMTQLGQVKGKARAIPTPAASVEMHVAKGTPEEDKNVEAVKAMEASFESKKEADFLASMTDDVEYADMSMPENSKGKGEAKKFFAMFTKAIPDIKNTVSNATGVEDFVIVESNVTGTQKGALGPFAASKKPVNMHGIDIFQLKDGKVVKGWTFSNNVELLTQIGVMKPPAAAAAKTETKTETKGGATTTTTTTGAKPATPATPAKPATPATPATAKPATPATPATPAKPATPATPATPAAPKK
jgi:steroid delta-isomerase-like uncharacterized protein